MKAMTVALAVLVAGVALADNVYLKSGSVLSGTVAAVSTDEIAFKSDDLGDVKIKLDKIVKLENLGDHAIRYKDYTVETKPLAVADGRFVSNAKPVDMANVKDIDPQAETWHGSLAGAFSAARGNTYENAWSLMANVNRRWEFDRVSGDLGYYYSETGTAGGERQKSTDRWEIEAHHDHFWLPKVYSYENLRYDRDKIAQLDARYRLGLGGGYQWLDGYVQEATGKWNFNQEVGLDYVNEQYENNDDAKKGGFAALRYAHHLNYFPKWNPDVEVFHNCEYLPEVDEWEKYLMKANIGFSTKIILDFSLVAKIEWDYNSKPANDRKKSDVRYIVGLGYKW